MLVELNTRGNGACPICAFIENCHIRGKLIETLEAFSSEDDPMELVIYSCPSFKERY